MRNTIKKHIDFAISDQDVNARSAFFFVRARTAKFPDNPRYGLVVIYRTSSYFRCIARRWTCGDASGIALYKKNTCNTKIKASLYVPQSQWLKCINHAFHRFLAGVPHVVLSRHAVNIPARQLKNMVWFAAQ